MNTNIFYTHIDDRMTVDKPHDPGFGVAGDTAAEPGAPALGGGHLLRFRHEARFELLRLRLNELRGALPARLHLPDLLDGHHALGQLGLVDDTGLAGALDNGPGLVGAIEVGGPADVLTGVFRVHPTEVHGNITKVIDRSESGL